MPDKVDDDLRLLCVPPLGAMIGLLQQQQEAPLTKEEVEKLASGAPCIEMRPEDYWSMLDREERMHVDPSNAWDDWQRAKADYGFGYMPLISIGIPGNEEFRLKAVEFLTTQEDTFFDIKEKDPTLVEDCQKYSFKNEHDFLQEDLESLANHSCVIYFRNTGTISKLAHKEALRFLNLADKLLDLGGLAVIVDTSSLYHSKANWKSLVSFIDGLAAEDTKYWGGLFAAYVQVPLSNENDCYSSGMHMLGAPDMVASTACLEKLPGSVSPLQAAYILFHEVGFYSLTEGKRRPFRSGHTFQLTLESPILSINWEPCTQVREGTNLFNPYGMWRFDSVGQKESESIMKKLQKFFDK